jgi:hypothetical protein
VVAAAVGVLSGTDMWRVKTGRGGGGRGLFEGTRQYGKLDMTWSAASFNRV